MPVTGVKFCLALYCPSVSVETANKEDEARSIPLRKWGSSSVLLWSSAFCEDLGSDPYHQHKE